MKYELQDLETMVLALIKGDRKLFNFYARSLFPADKNMVSAYKRICTGFMEFISGKTPEMLQEYFQQQQESLVTITDKIYDILNSRHQPLITPAITAEEILILERLTEELKNILCFIKNNLTAYFKFDGKVPDSFLTQHKYRQANNHLFIECFLLLRGAQKTMVTHLITVLKFENCYPRDEISFAQYDYVINTQKELMRYLQDKHDYINNHRIMKLLFTLNLNSMKRLWENNNGDSDPAIPQLN
jgi:hypothetical protein